MATEPVIHPKPTTHALVLAGAVVLAGGAAWVLGWMLGGTLPAAMAAIATALAAVPAALPMLAGRSTVPSRFGAMVLFGTMAQTLVSAAAGGLITMTTDIEAKPFWIGVLAGAFVLLTAQVAYGIWVLREATHSLPHQSATSPHPPHIPHIPHTPPHSEER